MTRVLVWRDPQGRLVGLRVTGHTGAGTRGNDLVCSAVSVLAQTAPNALEEILEIPPFPVQVSDGLLEFTLPEGLSEGQRDRADIILRTVLRGLKDIEIIYPKHLQIEYKDRRETK